MSTTMQIAIENLKCGGCERSILKGLATIEGVAGVQVDRERQIVSVDAAQSLRQQVADKLRSMGYPEKGSVNGFDAGLANARSFVSCAIGRVS